MLNAYSQQKLLISWSMCEATVSFCALENKCTTSMPMSNIKAAGASNIGRGGGKCRIGCDQLEINIGQVYIFNLFPVIMIPMCVVHSTECSSFISLIHHKYSELCYVRSDCMPIKAKAGNIYTCPLHVCGGIQWFNWRLKASQYEYDYKIRHSFTHALAICFISAKYWFRRF